MMSKFQHTVLCNKSRLLKKPHSAVAAWWMNVWHTQICLALPGCTGAPLSVHLNACHSTALQNSQSCSSFSSPLKVMLAGRKRGELARSIYSLCLPAKNEKSNMFCSLELGLPWSSHECWRKCLLLWCFCRNLIIKRSALILWNLT